MNMLINTPLRSRGGRHYRNFKLTIQEEEETLRRGAYTLKGSAFVKMMSKYPKVFLASLYLGIFAIFLLGFLANHQAYFMNEKGSPPCSCCENRLTRDTITPLEDKRTFIISPYYDGREKDKPMIRTLSIIHHQEVQELYCWFCCVTNRSMNIAKVEMDKHSDRFEFPYVTTDLLCTEPPNCHAKYLIIHPFNSGNISQLPLFQISNRDQGQLTANFTVCISTMFGNFNNVLQFIQAMEMYQMLGAQRVMIYLNSCSPLMEKVISYYIGRGVIEVIPWPIERHLQTTKAWHHSMDAKDIGYYGQLATLNDCVYRNMYRSRYILLNDIDEIILPFKHQTWDSMMEDLEQQNPNAGIFLFENHVFPHTVRTNRNFTGTSLWKDVPGFNILQYVHREPIRVNYFNDRKMIINPRKVIQTSVHSVLKHFGKEIRVPLSTAMVRHCREPLQKKLARTVMIEDKTIWKYNVSLITNVNKVLSEIPIP